MEKYCRNCGNHGHLYHECNNPILSYGVIIYHKDKDDKIEIVMIERKDSLAFIDQKVLEEILPESVAQELRDLVNKMTTRR